MFGEPALSLLGEFPRSGCEDGACARSVHSSQKTIHSKAEDYLGKNTKHFDPPSDYEIYSGGLQVQPRSTNSGGQQVLPHLLNTRMGFIVPVHVAPMPCSKDKCSAYQKPHI